MIQHTASYWTSANPVLPYGEMGQEVDTGLTKIGDGVMPWNDLPYNDRTGVDIEEITKAQITANQNDYVLGQGNLFRVNSDATRSITGIAGGYRGKRISLYNHGSFRIRFTNEDASSSAANRIITGTGTAYQMNSGETLEFLYDYASTRWRRVM